MRGEELGGRFFAESDFSGKPLEHVSFGWGVP
jgi:hypothetical protein